MNGYRIALACMNAIGWAVKGLAVIGGLFLAFALGALAYEAPWAFGFIAFCAAVLIALGFGGFTLHDWLEKKSRDVHRERSGSE